MTLFSLWCSQSYQILTTQLVYSTKGICIKRFYSLFIFIVIVVMNYCYYSIVFKLSALPLFINTGNIILPVYLGELSRGGEWHRCSPWEMCLLLSLWIHLCLGAQSCLYFEGHTGTIKNQPDAKQLETKTQLEGRKGTGGKKKSNLFEED